MSKKKPTMREQIADLEAELAGCEATIEELEAQNAALQKRVDEGDFGAIRKLHDAREELRTTLRDLHATSTERNDWKATAQSLAKIVQENGDKYFELVEKTESQRARNMVRRAVRRVLEVVR